VRALCSVLFGRAQTRLRPQETLVAIVFSLFLLCLSVPGLNQKKEVATKKEKESSTRRRGRKKERATQKKTKGKYHKDRPSREARSVLPVLFGSFF
jgi:hypothetical protein